MSLMEIIESVETVAMLDDQRQETFRDEYRDFEHELTDDLSETRECIAEERAELATLGDLLERERENLDELAEETEFFTVDQAVRHRDAVVEKIESHNQCIEGFRTAVDQALDAMESNLDAIVEDGVTDDIEDVEQHLQTAYSAVEDHNEVVKDLDRNLMIVSAYLP